MRQRKKRSGRRKRQRMERRDARQWSVDAALQDNGRRAAWALVDPALRTVGTGTFMLDVDGPKDSTRAESIAVREALAHTPPGSMLASDCKSAVKGPHHAHHDAKRRTLVAEIATRANERDIKLEWRKRGDPGIRAAHEAARRRLERATRIAQEAHTARTRAS